MAPADSVAKKKGKEFSSLRVDIINFLWLLHHCYLYVVGSWNREVSQQDIYGIPAAFYVRWCDGGEEKWSKSVRLYHKVL